MIETELLSLLKNDPGITDIIGARVYPLYLPQGLRTAAIVYQQIGSSEDYSTAGAIGIVDYRFQITCWSPTSLPTVQLAAAVRNCLTNAGFSTEGILAVRIEGTGDIGYVGETEAANRYGKYLDVIISYAE